MLNPFFVGCAQAVPVENRNSLIIYSVLSCKGDGFTPAILEGTTASLASRDKLASSLLLP